MSGKASTGRGRAGVRILIADDDAAIRDSLERVLQVEGYDTSTVGNGLAVLDGVTGAGGDALDLLILDVMMPRLGGLETCRRLRAAGRDLPVLMLTARDQVSDRVTGLDAGADDYLPKPFATEELLARVRALLRRRTTADGEPQILSFADVRLDPDRFEAWRGAAPDPDRVLAPAGSPAQRDPGLDARRAVRGDLGLRHEHHCQQPSGVRELPAPQDGGRG
jgi:two-component system response regulator MprA